MIDSLIDKKKNIEDNSYNSSNHKLAEVLPMSENDKKKQV